MIAIFKKSLIFVTSEAQLLPFYLHVCQIFKTTRRGSLALTKS